MFWQEITFTLFKSQTERFEDALINLGACSVTLIDAKDEPIYEPGVNETPLWNQLNLTALFTQDYDIKRILNQLPKLLELDKLPPYKTHSYPDKDWERAWMDEFKPMKLGQRLWVCPSWHKPPKPDEVNIILDPGLAFGSGTHPTTELCLKWLDQNVKGNESVIDYGCGSGILAIAAIKLGASHAIGIDIDPQAIIASKDNANHNQISDTAFEVFLTNEVKNHPPVDILIANILATPLIDLCEKFAQLVKSKGKIALSGILKEQADSVLKAYSIYFSFDPVVFKGDWALLSGFRI
ncbi:50S ribosomal protein L11 methyltransferase [Thiotrichales bacterium 19S9-12]|nr:50S ribosomal protein L11 methyltransferase [Thiotrichales bacterium 19S9-11]MCF6811742.1 50S ribosomal protein L11 methyltransferase [Thiotrichales bacterium 19S9-12]